ncbi:hypothetical protein ABDK00_013545 [Niabella insulamsoli]|uniref:hypothetical protein n=1 Tax=Niabella insulamsoli TaxID=3144874 RepID=UPI0031FCC909
MKSASKIQFTILWLLIALGSAAQTLPQISYRDYGYPQPVKKVEAIYYSVDGDSIEKVEKITRCFNSDGNIESYENRNFLDDSWAKANSIYNKGKLQTETWTHSNPYLNRTYTYRYNRQGRIVEERIRFKDGSKNQVRFIYQDSLLERIQADMDGTKSETMRYYSAKGKLYKEIHRQKAPGEADIVTNYFYLDDKEIISYVEPKSYFYATAYLNDLVEIKFKLIEDSVAQNKLLKGIHRFEKEAPIDNLPFGLQQYSEQTLQTFEKNKGELIPFKLTLYLKDKYNNIIAEADVDVKTKNITGIGFFKITLANNSVIGNTAYDRKVYHEFVRMLQALINF